MKGEKRAPSKTKDSDKSINSEGRVEVHESAAHAPVSHFGAATPQLAKTSQKERLEALQPQVEPP